VRVSTTALGGATRTTTSAAKILTDNIAAKNPAIKPLRSMKIVSSSKETARKRPGLVKECSLIDPS
jgi:hypothetical protein